MTIINYYGTQKSQCGYCKGKECSISHGMHAFHMNVQDYQDLIDRGWRRCGNYCYKPTNHLTCCPCYTIRCDALDFKLSKSHKKILKRMIRFLRDGKSTKLDEEMPSTSQEGLKNGFDDGRGDAAETGEGDCAFNMPKLSNIPKHSLNLDEIAAKHMAQDNAHSSEDKSRSQVAMNGDEKTSTVSTISSMVPKKSEVLSNPPCKKAKQMRRERFQAKLEAKGAYSTNVVKPKAVANNEKMLKDYFPPSNDTDKHKLKIVLVKSSTQTVTDEVFQLYRQYQLVIHNDNPTRLTPSNLQRFCYKSPLQYNNPANGPDIGYGSFHQQYWLDDKLIAVGVIDVLPNCVSSVYFFYDPEYNFLSLGTYGSLREVEFVQRLAEQVPSLKYYYMGFYIHSCQKMRYKGKLTPSYLLCPETYNWNLLTDEIRDKFTAHKYQRLNTNSAAVDSNNFADNDIDNVLLFNAGDQITIITYREYIQITGDEDDRDVILEYGRIVGKQLAHRLLFSKIRD